LKDSSVKLVYTQLFGFEWIYCLNKGQKCSGILKFLSSQILRCQVCNNQNDGQTMGSLQKDILFSPWCGWCLANSFCFKNLWKVKMLI